MKKLLLLGTAVLITHQAFASSPAPAMAHAPDPIHSDAELRIINRVARLTTEFQDLVNQAISIRSVACVESLQEWSRNLARFHADNTLNALTSGRFMNWGSVYEEVELLTACDKFVESKYNEKTTTIFRFISLVEKAVDQKNFYVMSALRHWCEENGQGTGGDNIRHLTRGRYLSWNAVLHEAGYNDVQINDQIYQWNTYRIDFLLFQIKEFVSRPYSHEEETINLFISLLQRGIRERNREVLVRLRDWVEITDPETGKHICTFTGGKFASWNHVLDFLPIET